MRFPAGRLRLLSRRSPVAAALALGTLVFSVVFATRERGWWMPLELGAYDANLRLVPSEPSEPIATLVWIGESDFARFGHPIPDRVLVQALREILRHEPRAVGIDVYRDRPVGEGRAELGELFRRDDRLVIVEKLADGGRPGVGPPAFLTDRRQVGFSDMVTDPDGVTRRGLLLLWNERGEAFVSFSLRLALRALHPEGLVMGPHPDDPNWIRLGRTPLPPVEPDFGGYEDAHAGGYQVLIDFRRANGSFPSAAFARVLDGAVDPRLVRDRVVILGTASPSVRDDLHTPGSLLAGSEPRIPGAEAHAHLVDQLVRLGRGDAAPSRALPDAAEAAWVLLACLVGGAVGARVRSPLALGSAAGVGLVALAAVGLAAQLSGWWIPVVPAAAGGLGSLGLVVAWATQRERAEKHQAVNLFGRFVSRRVADRIWQERDLFMEGDRPRPQRITITVLMSDLIGYTSRSEKAEPGEVMDWIGTYMDRMAALVDRHDGIVNDFLGDGLMASFGVPVASATEEARSRDARNAVDCALAMGEAMAELNAGWRRAGLPTARLRVGIHTGPAVVGALGSAERMKYAAVGDTVNTAARLESFDKQAFEGDPGRDVCRILIGQPTLERLSGGFVSEPLGEHRLRGKGDPVTVHRVLARAPEGAGESSAPPRAGPGSPPR